MPSTRAAATAVAGREHAALHASVDSIRRIVRALRLAEQRTQRDAGISAAQLYVLRALGNVPTASVAELATATLTDRSSVAAVVERLVDRGLVRRDTSRHDRRRATIAITARGSALLVRAPAPPTALLVAALRELAPRDLTQLARGLAHLAAHLGAADAPPKMLFEDQRPPPRGARSRQRVARTPKTS